MLLRTYNGADREGQGCRVNGYVSNSSTPLLRPSTVSAALQHETTSLWDPRAAVAAACQPTPLQRVEQVSA